MLFLSYYKISTIIALLVLLFYKKSKLSIFVNNIIYDNLLYKILVLTILLILIKFKWILILNIIFYIFFYVLLTILIINCDVEAMKFSKIKNIKTLILFFLTYYYNNAFTIHYNIIYLKKTKQFYIKMFILLLLSINFILINLSLLIANIIFQSILNYKNSDKSIIALIYYIILNLYESLNNKILVLNTINTNKKIYKMWSKNNGKDREILASFFRIYDKKIINSSNVFNNTTNYHINRLFAGNKKSNKLFHFATISEKNNIIGYDFYPMTWFSSIRSKMLENEYPINDSTKCAIVLANKETIISRDVEFSDNFKRIQKIYNENDLRNPVKEELTDNKTQSQFLSEIAKKSKEHLEEFRKIKIFALKDEKIIDLNNDKLNTIDEILLLAEQYNTTPQLINHILISNNALNSNYIKKQELINDFFHYLELVQFDEKLDILKKNNIDYFNDINEDNDDINIL